MDPISRTIIMLKISSISWVKDMLFRNKYYLLRILQQALRCKRADIPQIQKRLA